MFKKNVLFLISSSWTETYLHGVHEGFVERVVQIRDDWAERIDVSGVDQLLWPRQLYRMDERPHQVAG